ncbi:MAG: HepT-like ribonuclease domain-containing protein [Candidatus Micrarchaeia archaeon]|jgi:uncharacterized protein YutE (UPF0331/DUF86 family)
MIDLEQVSIMVRDIEKYLSDLEAMGINSKKDLEEREKYYALSMIVFAVMNRAIDIGNELISGSEKIQLPATYKETFEILSKNRIISKETELHMISLMKYRNAIAHNYYQISNDEIYSLKNKIQNVRAFVSEIKKYAGVR